MKKSVMKKWVAALRSGKYKQGRGKLKVGNKYCCLGVLCDISKKGNWLENETGVEFFKDYLDQDEDCLPIGIQKWAHMYHSGGTTKNGDHSLVDLNDDGGNGFKRIANFIEKNYKEL